MLVAFEFDPDKSAANLVKHGIDFVAAQTLWSDTNLVMFDARSEDEPRLHVIANLDGKVWSAFVTLRGDSSDYLGP